MAERGGFEPPVPFGHTRFPSVLLKPLGHLSGAGEDMTIETTESRPTGGSKPGTEDRPTALMGAMAALSPWPPVPCLNSRPSTLDSRLLADPRLPHRIDSNRNLPYGRR